MDIEAIKTKGWSCEEAEELRAATQMERGPAVELTGTLEFPLLRGAPDVLGRGGYGQTFWSILNVTEGKILYVPQEREIPGQVLAIFKRNAYRQAMTITSNGSITVGGSIWIPEDPTKMSYVSVTFIINAEEDKKLEYLSNLLDPQ